MRLAARVRYRSVSVALAVDKQRAASGRYNTDPNGVAAVSIQPKEDDFQPKQGELRLGRALVVFLLAYVAVTVIAAAFSMVVEVVMHPPPTADKVHSLSYVLSERFYPLLNFFVWTAFGRIYFGADRDMSAAPIGQREAIRLGALWLALALLADFVGFVLIEHPFSLNAHDFYVEQFPWIYLVYVVVFAGPLCAVVLQTRARRTRQAPPESDRRAAG
jgi:hypothetical protein